MINTNASADLKCVNVISAKQMLIETNAILEKALYVLQEIKGEIFGPEPEGVEQQATPPDCILDVLDKQRRMVEKLIEITARIQEGLY